ncbi:MAG: PilZ domain-containing protein [Fibrobacterota bacterium]
MRIHNREPLDFPVVFFLEDEPKSHEGRIHNISAGGLGLIAYDAPTIGDEIHIPIPINNAEIILHGVIVRRDFQDNETRIVGVSLEPESQKNAERIIHILSYAKQYREDVKALEGRDISLSDAAREWSSTHPL